MKRVLIVEDERDLSRLLEAALHTFDATIKIVMVPSAEEAILEVTRHPFDLLVTDFRLPGITGFELIKKVRAKAVNIRVIVLTGMQDPRVDEQAKDLNLDGFLRKPITITEFIDVAVKALEFKPVSVEEAKASGKGEKTAQLTKMLETLQEDLDAILVALVDQSGGVFLKAGRFPDVGQEKDWLQSLLGPLTSIAQIHTGLEKAAPLGVISWKGSNYDFLLSPVAATYGLVILLKSRRGSTQLALALDKILQTHPLMEAILKEMSAIPPVKPEKEEPVLKEPGVTEAPTRPIPVANPPEAVVPEKQPEVEPAVEEEVSEEFLALFQAKPAKTGQEAKTADFWDNLSESELAKKAVDPDTITYDQALQLGLLPDEDKSL